MIFHPVSPALRRVSNRFALSFATKFLKTYLPLTFVLYAALAVSAATAATTAYKVERLLYQSSTGPSSVAKAINANGEAVGVISNSGEDIPTLWDVSGRSTDMTVPGAPFFTELGGGINRAGDVPLNHGGRAYVWNAGVLRERRVSVVIAGTHRLPLRRDDDVDAPYRLAARLAQAGVRYCIGRSGGPFAAANERNLPYEAATAVAHGLPRDEALKAITLYPAQILGVADRLGALAPGLLASFIVTDGDPLETATQVERVFIQGREVASGNRQTRLADKYRQKYEQLEAR